MVEADLSVFAEAAEVAVEGAEGIEVAVVRLQHADGVDVFVEPVHGIDQHVVAGRQVELPHRVRAAKETSGNTRCVL